MVAPDRYILTLCVLCSVLAGASGHIFSKDGILTKIVEALPGGGFITGPVHAAAGNPIHAAQASIAGFGTLAAAVLGGPPGAFVAGAMTPALSGIFNELGLSDDKKAEVTAALDAGDTAKANKIVADALREIVARNVRELVSRGRWSLKSIHGTHLRAYDVELKVDLARGEAKAWERWYIQERNGKIVLKANHSPDKYLQAHPDAWVDLAQGVPRTWEQWMPFKNDDGSWSFLSVHGTWLSANGDGSVILVKDCNSWEHFWLESW